MPATMTLSEKYRTARKNKGFTQQELAKQFNEQYGHLFGKDLKYTYYRDVESKGTYNQYTYFIAKLCDVSPAWMLEDQGSPEDHSPLPEDYLKDLIQIIREMNFELEQLKPDADDELKLRTYVMAIAERYNVNRAKAAILLE